MKVKRFLILPFKRQAEPKMIHWLLHLEVVVHTGEDGEVMPPREAILHCGHRAQVVDNAVFGIVGEPKQLSGEAVLEAAVGLLIADLQAVAPVQFGIQAMLARQLVIKCGKQFAA